MAIEAAEEADRMLRDEDQDRRRIAELVPGITGPRNVL